MSNPQSRFLETANRIGRRLCRDAIWAGNQCTWLGWSKEPINGVWANAYRAAGSDLYNGTSGIALFLAHLYRFTGDAHQKRALIGAVNQVLGQIENIPEAARIGFYSGATGAAYALTEIGRILQNDTLITRGIDEIVMLGQLPLTKHHVDVIGGSAGVIPACLDLAARYQRPELIDIARRHGDHLLSLTTKSANGWSWDTMNTPGQKHLTGHSHGLAGIVTAMLELFHVTRDRRYQTAALKGLRYDRHHFIPEHNNWPDFRQMDNNPNPDPNAPPSYMLAWCHGAPGIGMSRLRTYELMRKDKRVLKEIDVAIQSTAQSLSAPIGPGAGNFSLCHGAGGNADMLLMAADQLKRPELRQTAESIGDFGIQQFEQPNMPWPCGIAGSGEAPNLMLGTAGIGYFYLRLFDSKQVPTILLIAPEC